MIRLRPVTMGDADLLLSWANEPRAREVSFDPRPITREHHIAWLDRRLADPAYSLWLGINSQGQPVGHVRYRLGPESALVSVIVDAPWRGRGYGQALIVKSAIAFFAQTPARRIEAHIKQENEESVRAFAKAGYQPQGRVLVEEQWAQHYTLERRLRQTVAISQPTYLPWMGYFELIDAADSFVYLDSVQFVRQSWQHRNRIKTPTGLQWLTIPVSFSGRFGQLIEAVEIRTSDFARKHVRALELNYRRAPYFDRYFPRFASILEKAGPGMRLSDLNIDLCDTILWLLGIRTPTVRSSVLEKPGRRTQLLAEICSSLDAARYYSPLGSTEYLLQEADILRQQGIEVLFQNFRHPEYEQRFPPFAPHASVLDLLFNQGPGALEIIRAGRRAPFSLEQAAQAVAAGGT